MGEKQGTQGGGGKSRAFLISCREWDQINKRQNKKDKKNKGPREFSYESSRVFGGDTRAQRWEKFRDQVQTTL